MNNLRAALTLTFEDQVSSGLAKLKDGLEALKRVGRDVGLTGLDRANSALRDTTAGADRLQKGLEEVKKVGREVRLVGLENAGHGLREATSGASALTRELTRIAGAADRAMAALRQTGQAVRQWGSNTFGPSSRIGGFAAAASGYSVVAPVQHYAGLEDQVRGIAIMKGLSERAMGPEITRLTKFFEHEALSTGQTSHAGAETYRELLKAGTPLEDVEEVLAAHHRAATAFYAKPEEFTKVTAALKNHFKVPHSEMDQALSAVGLAANLGLMTVPQFGQQFPEIASLVATKRFQGREGANKLLAMMQTQMMSTSNAGSAGPEVYEGIEYLFGGSASNHFEMRHHKGEVPADLHKLMDRATGGKGFSGINILQFLKNVDAAGLNPVEAMLDKLDEMKRIGRLTDTESDFLFGHIFGNKQAANFWRTQLRMRGKRQEMEARLNAVDPGEAKRMFDARFGGPQKQMDVTGERLEQLNRRLGKGFLPVMRLANVGLEKFERGLRGADDRAEGLGDTILAVIGGGLLLSAALGALATVAPVVAAGFSLIAGVLLNPLALALGALAAGAYYVMSNWQNFEPFFTDIWEGTKRVFLGVARWVNSTLVLDHVAARNALIEVWEGGKQLFGGAINAWKLVFTDLVATLDGWTGGAITDVFQKIAAAIGAAADRATALADALSRLPDGMFSGNGASRATPNTPQEYLPPGAIPGSPGSGSILELPFNRMSAPLGTGANGVTTIYIRAEPGTVVTRTEGGQNGIEINPGPTTVRI